MRNGTKGSGSRERADQIVISVGWAYNDMESGATGDVDCLWHALDLNVDLKVDQETEEMKRQGKRGESSLLSVNTEYCSAPLHCTRLKQD